MSKTKIVRCCERRFCVPSAIPLSVYFSFTEAEVLGYREAFMRANDSTLIAQFYEYYYKEHSLENQYGKPYFNFEWKVEEKMDRELGLFFLFRVLDVSVVRINMPSKSPGVFREAPIVNGKPDQKVN